MKKKGKLPNCLSVVEVRRSHVTPDFRTQIMFLKNLQAAASEMKSRTCTFKGSVEDRSYGALISGPARAPAERRAR